jgi:hypothetical protein
MNEQPDSPEHQKTLLQTIWDIAKAIVLVGAEKIWALTKKLATIVATFAIANPVPASIIGGVLFGLMVLWLFWPSGESENQKKADNAAEQGITKTAEVEQQKEVTANVQGQMENQETRVEAANTNVVVAGSRTKAARERAAETAKAAQRAQERTREAREKAVKDAKLDEVIANCEKVYQNCK